MRKLTLAIVLATSLGLAAPAFALGPNDPAPVPAPTTTVHAKVIHHRHSAKFFNQKRDVAHVRHISKSTTHATLKTN